MNTTFDIHPDMERLIASKLEAAQASSLAGLRSAWDSYGASTQHAYPAGMAVYDTMLDIDGMRSTLIPIRVYRPSHADINPPCVVYLHGGAFVKGSLTSGDSIAWGISDYVAAVVVSVDYRLAPEHPFPAAPEDCYAALCHIASHGSTLGIDPGRIAVWGDSAGGNLAAATCLMARDRDGPKIAAQALNYPCLTDELTAPAYTRYAESPGLRTASMEECWDAYLAGDRPTVNAYAAPLKARDLSFLPPAHVHVAEIDPLSDDGRIYAERLRLAGSPVVFACAARMIHGFLRARFFGPAAAAEFARPCAFLRQHLYQ